VIVNRTGTRLAFIHSDARVQPKSQLIDTKKNCPYGIIYKNINTACIFSWTQLKVTQTWRADKQANFSFTENKILVLFYTAYA